MVIFMHLFAGSRYPEINKRISAWVNKNKEFPDYVDVLNLVKKVTKQSSLPLRPETVRVQGKVHQKIAILLLNLLTSSGLTTTKISHNFDAV